MRRDVLLTLGARLLIVAGGFASSIVTARFLGPQGRGEYFFFVMLAGAIVQFGALGLHASNTYLAARDRTRLPALTANSVIVALGVGSFAGVVTALLLPQLGVFPATPDRLFWYAALLAPPTLFFLLGSNLLVGTSRITAFNAVDVGSRVLVLAALVVAGLLALDVDGFAAASIIAWTASAALLAASLGRAVLRPRFDLDTFRAGLRFAAKTYVVAVLGFAVLRGSIFLLQHYHGSIELGYYSIASQIADVLALLPASIALVIFPALVRDTAGSWPATRRSVLIVVAGLVVGSAAAWLLAEPFIRIAYGAEFTPAAAVLRWLLPGVIAIGATTVLSQYLAAHGLPKMVVGVWAIGFTALAVLGFALVPGHGASGAAVALSGAYLLVLGLICVLVVRLQAAHAAAIVSPRPEPERIDQSLFS